MGRSASIINMGPGPSSIWAFTSWPDGKPRPLTLLQVMAIFRSERACTFFHKLDGPLSTCFASSDALV